MTEYWAEGNSNVACRNLYKALNAKKLELIQDVFKLYQDMPDAVEWIDNNVGRFFTGFYASLKTNNDRERWTRLTQAFKEKSPYLIQASSLESIVLYMMQADLQNLRKLLKVETKCKKDFNKSACEFSLVAGGANTTSALKQIRQCNSQNTVAIVKILKKYDNPSLEQLNTDIIDNLANDITKVFKINDDLLFHSSRSRVLDIWNIVMFLYTLSITDLKRLYQTK
jgi:hypothetical protein